MEYMGLLAKVLAIYTSKKVDHNNQNYEHSNQLVSVGLD